MESFLVYIIYSVTLDRFYVGYTCDLKRRMVEHNTCQSVFTAASNDWELRWSRQFMNRQEAIQKEKKIKKKKGRKDIDLVYLYRGMIAWF